MAVESGFFESEWDPELYNEETHEYGDWDRKYVAEQFARYFSKFISNGVMNDVVDQLKVTASEISGQMAVVVSSGFAFINGFWCYNDDPLTLAVPSNETPSTRYDSVRVRWNFNTRRIDIIYIADDIVNVRNEYYYDLQIAQIKVDPSVSEITNNDITDTRSDKSLCGLVSKSEEFIIDNEEFTFVNKVCTISDARITNTSLADVYFDSLSFDEAERVGISVETYNGYLTLTAERTPTSAISGTIKVRMV